jgi:murein L,D-transpeptidase YcbB/YkuD
VENSTSQVSSGWITEKSYRFTGIKCGNQYSFRVKARNLINTETSWSNPVNLTFKCDAAVSASIEAVAPSAASAASILRRSLVSDQKAISKLSTATSAKPVEKLETNSLKTIATSSPKPEVVVEQKNSSAPIASVQTTPSTSNNSVVSSVVNSNPTSVTSSYSPAKSTAVAAIEVPTPISTSGPSLRPGNVSQEVKSVQIILKSLGYFDYSQTTGYFGPITRKAIQEFQKANGLPPVGIIGPLTRKILDKYQQ